MPQGCQSNRGAIPQVHPDVWLDRRAREIVAKMAAKDGALPDAIRDARRDKTHPWRAIARLIRAAEASEVDEGLTAQLVLVLYRYHQKITARRRLSGGDNSPQAA